MKPLFALLLTAIAAFAAEPEEFHSLLDREWDYSMKESPTTASLLGDRRWNDRWPDLSVEAMARRNEHAKELLVALGAIQRAGLSAKDQVSYDLLRFETELGIDEFASRLWTLPINQRDGIQLADDFAGALRFETVKDYEEWIARLRALPSQIDQTIALMRIGIAEKRTHARQVMEPVPGQIRKQVVANAAESPFYEAFKRWPAAIGDADRARLGAEARSAIEDQVVPAYRKLDDFFEREYQPACTEQVGAWQWPDGEAVYAFAARKFTTTRMTPREIHELGLREVERITAGMDRIIEQVGWKGSRIEFFEHLRGDKRFYCKTPEELLEAYRATAKKIDPTLVKVFKTLPRTPYGVEAIPANVAPNTTAAYYRPLAADGSRAGTFFVNLYRPQMRPRYEMMALAMHEAVPGHHLQFAIAFEQGDLPNFRRYGDGAYTAFVEGWALYSESLGDELGLYDDPYSKFGQLTYEIWRACRLVVDTGMHTMKWTRQQAIDYLLNHSAKTVLDVENEIDRYISWPGQALAYKIGELKIKELRARAANTLGEKFDVREFHDMLLKEGALPLEVLESQTDGWIEKVRQSARQ
ncbi:MAG: hypothetical protein JWL90_2462 [Chthoniobacteraceae bacterium]|nr:hypothetical protein [Chthoniobacteraceae bacterium]